ncbi:unnamed protein product [Calicophoron daubneyi]
MYVANGPRCMEWSPRGVDKFARCVLLIITAEGRGVILAPRGPNAWEEVADLSDIWQAFYVTDGRIARKDSSLVKEIPQWTMKEQRADEHERLCCTKAAEYIDALEDTAFYAASWSFMLRRPQSGAQKAKLKVEVTPQKGESPHPLKLGDPIVLFATLMKSGAICIWGIKLPLQSSSSVCLLYTDYAYAVHRTAEEKSGGPRPLYMKLCDLDATHTMLVLVLADGSVIGRMYTLQFIGDGSFSVQWKEDIRLCANPTPLIPVIASAWSMLDGVLCLGYGSHLLIACVKLMVSEYSIRCMHFSQSGSIVPTYQLERELFTRPDEVCGQITGVHLKDDEVFITTLDGLLASMDLKLALNGTFRWKILWSSSMCPEPAQAQWEFHGLAVSVNGVHLCFVERPVNYLDNCRQVKTAQLLPNVRFLSFWTNEKLHELLFNEKIPLHRKMDGLQELLQRWFSKSKHQSSFGIREECLKSLQFYGTSAKSIDKMPSSWTNQPVSALQLYRFILCLLTEDPDSSVKKRAGDWLTELDRLIHERYLERCFQLFLQSSVQRQANDCLLVIRMATLLLGYHGAQQDPASSQRSSSPPGFLVTDLIKLTKQVDALARQLYVHRFQLPISDIPSGQQTCPICSESIVPDLVFSKCTNGHPVQRCMQTLEPCCGITYRICERCDRVALALSTHDRVSTWYMTVVHPLCIFCDFPLIWKEY